MFLESVEYTQFEGRPSEWKLEGCTLGDINLIVGQNATGKSRTLNVIARLADLLSGDHKLTYLSGNYKVIFDNKNAKVRYTLKYENSNVIEERLDIDSQNRLWRGKDGIGEIYYEKEEKLLEFQTPPNELAVVARRDSIQHPFLQNLYDWGKSVRQYLFGTQLGKDQWLLVTQDKDKAKADQQILNLKDPNTVVAIFREGQKKFSNRFTDTIIRDMGIIGYELKEINTATPHSIVIQGALPGELVGLYVQESDLAGTTDQGDISQGMFRALSLIIQITYSQLAGVPSCILIDDIGEGLDYERSSALIKLLIARAKDSAIQLIMATNDRFVMNNAPLEYWSVIHRIGGVSKIYNYRNSPKLFKDFELTGLNNFDFFSSRYYLKDSTQN